MTVRELTKQVYARLFGKDISIDKLRPLLRLAHYISDHTLNDDIGDPFQWIAYQIAFDHLVPKKENNPKVLNLVIRHFKTDEAIRIQDNSVEFHRKLINETITKMGGKLGETSANGVITFWP